MIHPLENRRLFALAVSLDQGSLLINGTDVGDAITVDLANSMLSVQINTASFSLPAADVKFITVKSGGGSDRVSFTPAVTIKAAVYGGDGNDHLSAGSRSNSLYGEAGHDTLGGGTSRDAFFGGVGIDTVDYSARTDSLIITLDGKPNDGVPGAKKAPEQDNVAADIENVVGGAGNDKLTGSKGRNTLQGGPGNDSISGGGGDDLLVGGSGADTLRGDDGDDVLLAIDSSSADLVDGGIGFDSAALDSITSIKDTLLNIENDASILVAP